MYGIGDDADGHAATQQPEVKAATDARLRTGAFSTDRGIIGGMVRENPHYLSPDESLASRS